MIKGCTANNDEMETYSTAAALLILDTKDPSKSASTFLDAYSSVSTWLVLNLMAATYLLKGWDGALFTGV